MGMKIETAIRNLSMYDVNECGNAELHTWYKDIDKDMEESFKVAIDTMRKYQRVEQILKDIPYGGDATVRRIQEVIEDGNDD